MIRNLSKFCFKAVCASALLCTQVQALGWLGQSCCNPCESDPCCDQFFVDGEYLYWQTQDSPAPVPLLIAGPITTSPFVLNAPDTAVVLGGKSIDSNWRSGGKISLGYWFNECCNYGLEANYLFLPNESKTHEVSADGSTGSALLATPFFNVTTASEDSAGVAFPGSFSGIAKLKLVNNLQGAELNFVAVNPFGCNLNFGWLAGFRYFNFDEHLKLTTSSPYVAVPTDVWKTYDKFSVNNNFYGGQLGAGLEYSSCEFYVNVKAKVALGAMCEESNVSGKLVTNDFNAFGAPQTFVGGYFALPSNIGHHKHTEFSVIPEANINVGYPITDCLKVQVGYTFIYVNKLLRASKQIDRNINPSQSAAIDYTSTPALVGEASPKPLAKTSSFWVQGFNAGLVYRF